MGLPFSHFLLFGTFCLLGTSLRLIGTRLSGKMLLHTFLAKELKAHLLFAPPVVLHWCKRSLERRTVQLIA